MSNAGSTPAKVRSALRVVLRVVDRHLTHINGSQQWRREVISKFRAGPQPQPTQAKAHVSASQIASISIPEDVSTSKESGIQKPLGSDSAPPTSSTPPSSSRPIAPAGQPPTLVQALALAHEWAALVQNIARHKELLLSYNIGLDVDERTKRMVEATARRVGFALPKAAEESSEPQDPQRNA